MRPSYALRALRYLFQRSASSNVNLMAGLPVLTATGAAFGALRYKDAGRPWGGGPLIFVAALGVLASARLLASALPARRAATVDPLIASRSE